MKNERNNGFTLVELLAVIVVLAIIALIATPIILGIIDDVKKAAFERSVEISIKTFELYRATNENVKRIEITDERLPLNDNNFISGSLLSLSDGQIEAYKITDGKYCADGKIGELEVTNGACVGDVLDDFVINTYFLHVNPNGGLWNETSDITEVPIENNSKIDLVNPTREGYEFIGWEMNVVGNIDDADNGILTTEMLANWSPNTYKLIIETNGGTYDGELEFDVKTGTLVSLGEITKEGYDFIGWETINQSTKILSKNTIEMGTENTIISAKWESKTYTINYNCNGGSGSTDSSTHSYGVSKNLSSNGCYKILNGSGTGTSATPMVYYFAGWATSNMATEPTYTNEQSVIDVTTSESITLYAVWDKLFTYSKKYEVINDNAGNWRVKFYETGDFTLNYDIAIDAFLVGGGGNGGFDCGGGGGGGETTTSSQSLTSTTKPYVITIGKGGGGTTEAFGAQAEGGKAGSNYSSGRTGGSGGSGGGGGGHANGSTGGRGGYNGGNGGNGTDSTNYGKGQGSTTCEFGLEVSSGVCYYTDNGYDGFYAGGGGGGGETGGAGGKGGGAKGGSGQGVAGSSAIANTGGGGGGGSNKSGQGGAGGSGIVIIRNYRTAS